MVNSTQPIWGLSLGEVETALAVMSNIHPRRQSQLRFRLKNLFKVGFLPHIQQGRGKAGRYGAREIFELSVAIELMQFDLGPHRIAETMARLKDVIKASAREAGDYLSQGMQPLGSERHIYISFDPGGLESLSRDYGEEAKITERFYRGDQPLDDRIARRLAIINISKLSLDLALALEESGLCSPDRFGQLLLEWTDRPSAEQVAAPST